MARVVHFEIHAEDPERAMAFYRLLFGWQFQRFGDFDYWAITTGKDSAGIDGGLTRRRGANPAANDRSALNAFACIVGVDDIDQAIASAKAAGAAEALPKTAIPGVGWSAYFKDTENNLFGVFQPLPMAK